MSQSAVRLGLGGLALSLALVATDARAYQPPTNTTLGVEPSRVRTYDRATQEMMRQKAAWLAFTAGEGAGWQVRFDQGAGVPNRMWGPGLDFGKLTNEAQVTEVSLAFVERNAALLGLDDVALAVANVAYVPEMDAWYVDFDTIVDGVPVWRGDVTLRFKKDRLVMVGADTYPNAPITGEMVLTPGEALTQAIVQGPAPLAQHGELTSEAMLLPIETAGKLELRRVWRIGTRTETPRGKWVSFVDAETGDLLNVHNEIRFFTGEVLGQHDRRGTVGTLDVAPLRFARITGGNPAVSTDNNGVFTTSNQSSYTLALVGNRVSITDTQGVVNPTIPANPSVTVGAANFGGRQAALSTFHWVQVVQDWGTQFAPSVSWSNGPTQANVNINDVCNAFWDGTINMFQAGGGCNNTGRQADVIIHEWGHGFHFYSIVSGDFDGSLSEGVSDFTAVLQSGDSAMSPAFFSGGGGALRNTNNNRRYPDDFSSNAQLVHSNGLIIGGALWDTWQNLRSSLGEAPAYDAMSEMFTGMLRGGPEIPEAYDEIVFADDDDGNLANGTPNLCDIIDGFEQHGLGPASQGLVDVNHDPIVSAVADAPTLVEIDVSGLASCGSTSGALTGGTLSWRVIGGGRFNDVPMAASGSTASASIPAQPLGTLVEYYVSATANTGAVVSEPAGGDIRPHTFYTGDVVNVGCTRLDLNDGGLTSELVAGVDQAGANDWQWGRPNGSGGDPNTAFSGLSVWGNDLGPSGFNGLYQADKHNRLSSPQLNLRHYQGSFLNYRRWLTVEDGTYDVARIMVDGFPVWANHIGGGSDNHIDTEWASHVVPLGFGANDGRLTLNWEIISDGGAEFGGWNLDNLCISAPATINNRLGISNFRIVSSNGITNRLAFSAPKHGPISEVRVVRTNGAFPTGPEDGTIVFEDTSVSTLEAFTVTDRVPNGSRTNVRYAVYASDGSDWLGFTEEGWNAVRIP